MFFVNKKNNQTISLFVFFLFLITLQSCKKQNKFQEYNLKVPRRKAQVTTKAEETKAAIAVNETLADDCLESCLDCEGVKVEAKDSGTRLRPKGILRAQSEGKGEKRKKKAFKDLTYEERMVLKGELIAQGRLETAVSHIEKMIPLCNNMEELRDLTLEIADLVFEAGNLSKAEGLYNKFVKHYPGDQNIEYACYKSILCSFWQTLDPENDQTKTKNTIDASQKFLERSNIFTTYNEDVSRILYACNDKLMESDISIFRSHLNRRDWGQAHHRLKLLEKEFLPIFPDAEPKLIMLACELAEKQDNQKLLTVKKAELAAKYPNYEEKQIILAQNEEKKPTSFTSRF